MDRFAHVADMEGIEENDFNMNIIRSVDTTGPVEVISVGGRLGTASSSGA